MNFFVTINIMPHTELLDPQGKTVEANLPNVGLGGISKVRMGKHVELNIEASNAEEATQQVEEACKKILANVIMESYTYEITPV